MTTLFTAGLFTPVMKQFLGKAAAGVDVGGEQGGRAPARLFEAVEVNAEFIDFRNQFVALGQPASLSKHGSQGGVAADGHSLQVMGVQVACHRGFL